MKTTLTTQTAFPFDPPACDEPLTGDRTRIVRVVVKAWAKVSRKVRKVLRPVIGTYERKHKSPSGYVLTNVVTKRVRWNDRGECTVVDGSAAHVELVARLMEHALEFTQHAQQGRWCVVGDFVVMRLATIDGTPTAATILPVGMPVFARRGERWLRWRGAPVMWPYDRTLISSLARVA